MRMGVGCFSSIPSPSPGTSPSPRMAMRPRSTTRAPVVWLEGRQSVEPGFTTVFTKLPIASSVAPSASIWGKWAASGMGAKWPSGKASA